MDPSTSSPPSSDRLLKILIVLTAVIALILTGWALKYTRVVTMPLVFGFFVALLMRPVQVWLEKKLPDRLWWLALALTMLTILLALSAFFGVVWYAVQRISGQEIRRYGEQIRSYWQSVEGWLAERNLPVSQDGGGGMLMDQLAAAAGWLLYSLTDLAAMLVLIFFFVLLMLLEASRWKRKTRAAVNHHHGDVTDTIEAAAQQVRRFLLVQTFIAFTTAVAAGLWLWIIGVPFPLVWALLTFLLDYIPSVGSILSGALATLVALAALGWWKAILTAAGLVTIEQIMGNYVDPLLKSKRMGISPVVVLVSVLFWAWVWGAAGAVLAVPITATLIIICAHIPSLRPIALLLSTTADEEKLIRETSGTHNHSPQDPSPDAS